MLEAYVTSTVNKQQTNKKNRSIWFNWLFFLQGNVKKNHIYGNLGSEYTRELEAQIIPAPVGEIIPCWILLSTLMISLIEYKKMSLFW